MQVAEGALISGKQRRTGMKDSSAGNAKQDPRMTNSAVLLHLCTSGFGC